MIARVILCIVLLLPLAIAAQPPGGSLQDLLVQAHSNNAWERYRALQNLASLAEGYPEVQAVLLAGLHDPEALVRRGAAAGLLQAPRLPAALDPLLGALRDPDAEVRAAVAETLGYYGDARALAPLRELLKDKDPKARAGAVGGLGRLPRRDPAARAWGREIPDLLLAATGDPDPAVRAKAAEYLGYLRVARAEEALIRLLDDPSRDV
jgi:HEAT repeat protein